MQIMKKKQKPPWEDLDPCILSNIFSCLSPQDQLFGPPYVCRSWLSATLDTLFHNSELDLRLIDSLEDKIQRSRFTHLLRIAINRCDRNWVSIHLPSKHTFGYFATVYIAEKTPTISSVFWPTDVSSSHVHVYMCMFYWRKIKVFHARLNPNQWFNVLTQLADLCNNLVEIGVHGTITEKEALCIIQGFPRLKVLDMSESNLSSEVLGMLLDGRLENLREVNILHCLVLDDEGKNMLERDYSNYCYFKAWRRDILERASNLKSLKKFMHCLEKCSQQCG
ncbi:hypothetical protein Ddye_026688 [Dipteronia dyeriana]|uniref:F-box protein n=1 Tax=Dipteronia dyeriana TaxID=168575 RepID=A0AAD9TN59_9ROSI|nr:hypothetical protein Ddye_026688 [Dipteronia dyeriana]